MKELDSVRLDKLGSFIFLFVRRLDVSMLVDLHYDGKPTSFYRLEPETFHIGT